MYNFLRKNLVRICLFCVIATGSSAYSANYTAVLSGNWNSVTTWLPSGIPGAGDNVTIPSGLTVTLNANAQCADITITAPIINGTSSLNVGNFNLTVSGSITLNGGSTNSRIASISIQNGTVSVAGDITFNASTNARAVIDMSSGSGTFYLSGNVIMSTRGSLTAGTSSVFIYNGTSQDVGGFTYNNITFSNTGTKTFIGNATVNGTLSIEGTATIALSPRTLSYSSAASLQYKSSSAQTTGVEFSPSNVPPNLIIDNSVGVTLAVSGLTVNTLSLLNGPFRLNGNTLVIGTSSSGAVSRTNGYIVSETAALVPGGGTGPAGPGYGTLAWNIGSTAGNYVFPFGTTAGVLIPLTVTLSSGNAGLISAATYKAASDNKPYPDIVYHIYDNTGTGTDNSINTVDRFWILAGTGVAATVNLTFTYAQLSERPGSGLSDEADLYAQSWSGNSWLPALSGQTRTLGSETATSVSSVTVSNVSLPLSIWTLAKSVSPLPVSLVSFSASHSSSGALVKWTTATEFNVDYYIVEKSPDGKNFKEVGRIASRNSSKTQEYSFIDEAPACNCYYRLKEYDVDGLVVTFAPVFLSSAGPADKMDISIRLSGNSLAISSGHDISDGILRVHDMQGKELLKTPLAGGNTPHFLDISGLPSGVYVVSITGSGHKSIRSQKILKR